jgi:O-antigen/teichoic acid export membrane protein
VCSLAQARIAIPHQAQKQEIGTSAATMLNKIIIYSTSTGLQRAVTFLAVPILANSYEMALVGEYALMQTIAQLLVPLLTLNATVAITRETNDNPYGAIKLIRYVWTAASVVAGLALLLSLLFKAHYWYLLGIALGASEAIYASGNSFFLGKERSTKILSMSMIKLAAFMILVIMAFLHFIDIYTLMLCMVVQNYAIAAYFAHDAIGSVPKPNSNYSEGISPKEMLLYSFATLPHTAALWISIASDRLLIGSVISKVAVAQYVMSYTIAQSVMMVISGVITAVPPRVMNDPDTWRAPSHVLSFLTKLAKVCLLVTCVNIAFVYVDRKYLGLIPNLTEQSYMLVGLISTGFFFSMLYVFFASYLYLNRTTNALKIAGFGLAPLNLLVMYAGVRFGGQVGAAAALLFSYLSFGVAYGYAAARTEKFIKRVWRKIFAICMLFILVVISVALLARWIDA